MKLNVKATQLELNEHISDYLDKKLHALTKLFEDSDAVICVVELARDTHHIKGDVFRAEITLDMPMGFFRASETGETVYSAIDAAQEEVLKELRRSKDRRLHLLKRGGHRLKEVTRMLGTRGAHEARRLLDRFRRRR